MKKYNYTVRYYCEDENRYIQETQYAEEDGHEIRLLEVFANLGIELTHIWRYDLGDISRNKDLIYSQAKGMMI